MPHAAVFIDGGYLSKILKQHFNEAAIDYSLFAKECAESHEIFRVYYYDCPPYQSTHPTTWERDFISKRQKFLAALPRLSRFEVRLGRLEHRGIDDKGNPIFQQKRVDLQMGLDIASLASKGRVEMIVLVSGDSDLMPAVEFAKNESILVRLVHGPRQTYHQDLWDKVDERKEISEELIRHVLKKREGATP